MLKLLCCDEYDDRKSKKQLICKRSIRKEEKIKKIVSILTTVTLLGILFSQTVQAAETYENIGEYKINDKIKEKIVRR